MGKLYLGDQEIGVYQMEKAEQPLVKYTVDSDGKISKTGDAFVLPSNVRDFSGNYVFFNACNRGTVTSADLSSLTAISGNNSAASMFNYCSNLTSANLSSLTTIRGGGYGATSMFSNCSKLASVDLGSLTTVIASYGASNMFSSCVSLTSIDLSSLITISGGNGASSMFSYCSNLVSADLSSLTTVSGTYGVSSMFQNCSNLTSVDLSSLTTISGSYCANSMFQNCKKLQELRFPALTENSFGSYTSQFGNMLGGVTGCTVHFPASTQAKVETLNGYPNFGGTNTTVLFDL